MKIGKDLKILRMSGRGGRGGDREGILMCLEYS